MDRATTQPAVDLFGSGGEHSVGLARQSALSCAAVRPDLLHRGWDTTGAATSKIVPFLCSIDGGACCVAWCDLSTKILKALSPVDGCDTGSVHESTPAIIDY